MSAILAFLPTIIALIPLLTKGVDEIIHLISLIRDAAKQNEEWTEELETAFLNALIATKTDPAWQPDANTDPAKEGQVDPGADPVPTPTPVPTPPTP